MFVTVLLADYAQVPVPGSDKISAIGLGWTRTTTPLPQQSVVVLFDFDWTEANERHSFRVELLTEDHRQAVTTQGPTGEAPLAVDGDVEVGRPAGVARGSVLRVPWTLTLPAGLPLLPGSYLWLVTMDGDAGKSYRASFQVIDPAAAGA